MANLIDFLLTEAGFATRRFTTPDAPDTVYGELRGSAPNPYALLLYNHYDVQPPEPLELWLSPPFEPTVIEEPIVQKIIALAESYSGEKAKITPISGGTLPLLGALRRRVGVPGLSAPGNPTYWANAAHAPNEHIRLDDLRAAILLNCHILMRLGQ